MLTQQRLQELLAYNPVTGVFTWKPATREGWKHAPGDVAGCLGQGYWRIRVDGVLYKRSRLAWLYMTGHWPNCEVDHRNLVKSDDRWENLRDLTGRKNSRNNPIKKNNTSGHTGVSWDKRYQKWQAYLMLDRKKIHLGYFASKDEAVTARQVAEKRYWHV